MDAATGTLTLKGQKGERRFQVHDKVKEQLDGLKIGDKVIVKHVDEIALPIVKPRTNKNAQDRKEKGARWKRWSLSLIPGKSSVPPQSSSDCSPSCKGMVIFGASFEVRFPNSLWMRFPERIA